MAQARQMDRPGNGQGRGETYRPSASIWPLIGVVAVAVALPGLVHGLPLEAQVGLVASGALVAAVAIIGWIRDDLVSPLRDARLRIIMAPADPPAPYTPAAAGGRNETGVALHLHALKDVATLRFNFPTEEHRHFKTYLNRPQNTMGIQMPGGTVAYPDLVVVQSPENYSKMVAQVETADTINEDVAYHVWGPYAELAPLYLYVPVGKGHEALALCRRLDVPVVGIRTWRHMVGYDGIEINDYYTV